MVTKTSKETAAPDDAAKLPAIQLNSGLALPDFIPGAVQWSDLVADSHTVMGNDLAKDELLDALVGVPFLIHSLTFRRGINKPGIPWDSAVCAAEAVLADEQTMKRRRVNMLDLPFEPNQTVIFNDGSTGIYRQLVAFLEAAGYIHISHDLPEAGGMGESRYDLPPSEWTEIHAGEIFINPATEFVEYRANIRLTCPRGLRLSEYQNDFNPTGGKTRYLA